jgi:3-oxoadipate enol-lactonase
VGLTATAAAQLERRTVGSGDPVTVVAHGFGQDVGGARLLAAGVAGTRLLYAARGHGASPQGDQPLSYALLADDLDAVGAGATRALGTSLGGTTILHLLARVPDRFARVVITRPAPLVGGEHLHELLPALRSRDAEAVRRIVRAELPTDLGAEQELALRLRVRALLASPALADVAEQLQRDQARPDPAALARTTADVLLIAEVGDAVHPVSAAEAWAALVPRAELAVLDGPTAVRRRRLRQLIADGLAG